MLKLVRGALVITLAAYVLGVLGLAAVARAAPISGYGIYAVRSASMAPAIRVGDMVVEQRVDPAAIRPGDVITVQTGTGANVTHRVASVAPNDAGPVFTTKGDANPSPDPVGSTAAQVRGRVTLDVPLLGFVLAMTSMPTGLLALFSIGAVLLLAIWLVDELRETGEEEDLIELAHRLETGGAAAL